MKNILFTLLLLLSISVVSAQDFEGIIEFKTVEGKESFTNVWYIKGDRVRIDHFEPGSRVLISCDLINIKDSSVMWLDHKTKTFGQMLNKMVATGLPIGTTIETTKNEKEILTYKATESIVKAPTETFNCWVSSGNFSFFRPAVVAAALFTDYNECFLALDVKEGSMPLIVIRKNAAGEETGRCEAIRIEKRSLDENLFAIPAGYTSNMQLPPSKKE